MQHPQVGDLYIFSSGGAAPEVCTPVEPGAAEARPDARCAAEAVTAAPSSDSVDTRRNERRCITRLTPCIQSRNQRPPPGGRGTAVRVPLSLPPLPDELLPELPPDEEPPPEDVLPAEDDPPPE